jgi:hypothetical protein
MFIFLFFLVSRGFSTCAGFWVNIYEVAGPFTSIFVGIVNTGATLSGVIGPFLIGLITKNVCF